MIKIRLFSACWTPWHNACYVMDGKKFPIPYYGNPYWLLNDKLYFGIYQSVLHWEIKLYVAEGSFKESDLKNIRKHVDSFSHCQLLHWGNAIRQTTCYLPEEDVHVELTTTVEKHGFFVQTAHYHFNGDHIGQVFFPAFRTIHTGEVARIDVKSEYARFLPHLLGSTILTHIQIS